MINIQPIIKEKCPNLKLGILKTHVHVQNSNESLWAIIDQKLEERQAELELDVVSKLPTIQSTRKAYKALGKKPGRYRPSAEALTRRILQGKGLYKVNNVVDCLNLISVCSGYSIGGYDLQNIEGQIQLGRGEEKEPYEAIGRGELNIAGLPVLRDNTGAFGSPTSDSSRTMVTEKTTQFLMIFFNFGNHDNLDFWLNESKELLEKFAKSEFSEIECLSV